jgi:hypothetical protein
MISRKGVPTATRVCVSAPAPTLATSARRRRSASPTMAFCRVSVVSSIPFSMVSAGSCSTTASAVRRAWFDRASWAARVRAQLSSASDPFA